MVGPETADDTGTPDPGPEPVGSGTEGDAPQPPEWKLRIKPDPDRIPPPLRAIPQWVAWTLGAPAKLGDKPRKIPINPFTGTPARANDPSTWGTFQAAVDRWKRDGLAGIGFMLSDSGHSGVDLDGCVDPETGVIAEWAKQIAEEFCSYTELSPSGKGLRIIARGTLPKGRRKNGLIEVYDHARYVTMTGAHIEGMPTTIEDRSEELADLVYRLGRGGRKEKAPVFQASGEPIADDAQLVERASSAKNGAAFSALHRGEDAGHASRSEADSAYLYHLAFWTVRDATRMDRLFRASGRMREKWDSRRGDTTWGQRELAHAIASVHTTYRTARVTVSKPERAVDAEFRCTDTANARRLVKQFGADVRYSHTWKAWMVWDGRRWKLDDEGTPMEMSRLVVRDILREASECNGEIQRTALIEWAEKSEKVDRRKAMVVLAQSEKRIPLHHDKLDKHPMLFNAGNGTLDLTTGVLRKFQREDALSKLCPTNYVPTATCPTWEKFLERVFPDDAVRAYVQRLAGCCMTGDASDHVLVVAIGHGANGKTTFFKTLQSVLSRSYAIQIAGDLLLAKQQRGHPTELADLFGVRMAVGTETNRNQEFDEALVKQLTGGDLIRARRMRENFWEFEPTHKLILISNHMPRFRATEAMVRRVHLLRFDVTIRKEQRDRKLLAGLWAEREGILAWCVRGVSGWLREGLNPPSDMEVPLEPPDAATSNADDFIARFIEPRTGERLGATLAYSAFVMSCKAVETEPCSQYVFGSAMGRAGYGRAKVHGGNYIYRDAGFVKPAGTTGDDSRVDEPGSAHEAVSAEKVPVVPAVQADRETAATSSEMSVGYAAKARGTIPASEARSGVADASGWVPENVALSAHTSELRQEVPAIDEDGSGVAIRARELIRDADDGGDEHPSQEELEEFFRGARARRERDGGAA